MGELLPRANTRVLDYYFIARQTRKMMSERRQPLMMLLINTLS